ncbi:MAG: hypothetical protein WC749_00665 [Dehalococcoidia bacterium]
MRERCRALIAGTLKTFFHGNALSGLSVDAANAQGKTNLTRKQRLACASNKAKAGQGTNYECGVA